MSDRLDRRALRALRGLFLVAGALPWALAILGVRTPALERAFLTLCHQRSDRVLEILGQPMLVCSRCAGIYAGVAIGAVLPLPGPWLRWGTHLMIAALVALAADALSQAAGLHPVCHGVRLATGLAAGWTASAFAAALLRREGSGRRPPTGAAMSHPGDGHNDVAPRDLRG